MLWCMRPKDTSKVWHMSYNSGKHGALLVLLCRRRHPQIVGWHRVGGGEVVCSGVVVAAIGVEDRDLGVGCIRHFPRSHRGRNTCSKCQSGGWQKKQPEHWKSWSSVPGGFKGGESGQGRGVTAFEPSMGQGMIQGIAQDCT